MARTQPQEPTLNQGNRIYLYGLLSRELGCGKQTFLPRVEEVLAADRMTAEDLGFDNTRSLLEAMGDCVNLTVFKGGRIYATVVAQPAWDEALANPVEAKTDTAAKGGKPWKRKKADKSLKPVKPRRVKREIAEETVTGVSVDAATEITAAVEIALEAEPESAAVFEPDAETAIADEAKSAVPAVETEPETAPKAEPESVPEPIAAPQPTAQPTISLTVTYDPYSGKEGETTLAADMTEPAAATNREAATPAPVKSAISDAPHAELVEPTAVNAPGSDISPVEFAKKATPKPLETPITAPVAASTSTAQARRPSTEALEGYPHDFAAEVYCPANQAAELSRLLPLGTAVMPLLAKDFQRARDLELIEGGRSRATFPLRVQHTDTTAPIAVTIRKQSGLRLPWTIARVE